MKKICMVMLVFCASIMAFANDNLTFRPVALRSFDSPSDYRVGLAFPTSFSVKDGNVTTMRLDLNVLTEHRPKNIFLGLGASFPVLRGNNLSLDLTSGWSGRPTSIANWQDGGWHYGVTVNFKF